MIGLFIGPVLLAVSWRLFDAWVKEVPAPGDVSDNLLEKVNEREAHNKVHNK